jgi:imidazoleglycerol phosphate synthase glutamine amidotransferase subunit HisH
MIVIINSGIEKSDLLPKLLSVIKIDFEITDSEYRNLHAEKVILTHTSSITLAIKQLHLLNFFTMLRVCTKPMLGISTAMYPMADNIKNEKAADLSS